MRSAGYATVIFFLLTLMLMQGTASGDQDGALDDGGSRAVLRDPLVTIDLGIEVFQAEIEVNRDCNKVIQGEVRCVIPAEAPPIQTVIVELTSFCDGFETSNPGTLVFEKDTEVLPFKFNLEVKSYQKDGKYIFSVSGVWSYSPGTSSGTIEHAEGILEVIPYGAMRCEREHVNLTTDVGEWVRDYMTIKSNGNSECKVALSLMGLPPGVEVELNHDVLDFAPFGQVTLDIRIRQTEGSGKEHSFSLIGINSVPGAEADFEIQVNFITKGGKTQSDLQAGASVLFMSMAGVLVIIFIIVILVKILKRDRE